MRMRVDVEKLIPGATVLFPDTRSPAELVSAKPGEYWTFVYRDDNGFGEITLFEEELGAIAIVERGCSRETKCSPARTPFRPRKVSMGGTSESHRTPR
jgi:hypothetical protein